MARERPSLTHRVLAWTVAAALVVLPAWWIVSTAISAADDQLAALDRSRLRLARLRQALQAPPPEVPSTAADPALDAGLLPGGNPTIVAADLQRRISARLTAQGAAIDRLTAIPPPDEAPDEIGLRVLFQEELHGLAQILWDLETGEPALAVRALAIQRRAGRISRVGPGNQTEAGPVVIELELVGVREPAL
ncbi:MAG: type II secretion system protein GspM [Rhodothalassiaceae bacterium]